MSNGYRSPIGADGEPSHCVSSWRLVGDPIDVVTGANTDLTVDFRLQGPLPLRWRRHYNSGRNTVQCSLGWGQTHDYDRTLTQDLDGVRYADPSGTVVPFPPLEVGEHAVRAGFFLRRTAQNSFQLTQAGQPAQDFEFSDSSETSPLRRLRQGGAEIRFRYDDVSGLLVEIIDSLGRPISVDSHPDGRIFGLFIREDSALNMQRALIVYEYDWRGNLVVGKDYFNTTLGFSWDENNRMTRRTDRRGYSFHFAYDEQGRCVHSRGDDGLLEVLLDYRPHLKTTLVRRGDGGHWKYLYDAAGTITQIIDPYGGATHFTVDETGRVVEEIDPKGNVTQLLYDATGRHYARVDPLGYLLPTYAENSEPVDPLAYRLPETPLEWEHGKLFGDPEIRWPTPFEQAFGWFPRIVREIFLGTSDAGDARSESVDLRDEAQPAEDVQGRPVEQGPLPKPQRWNYDPNGNLAEYHDRDGAVFRYLYHSWNALHQEIDPLGHGTFFNQSSQGLVSRVEDPGGTVTEYAYDLKDRLVEIRCNGIAQERYRYDAAANIVEKTDGQGQTLVEWEVGRATLDAARRLASGETHTFQYDKYGRLIAAATPDGTVTFAFTHHGERMADKRDGVGVVNEYEGRQLASTTCFDRFSTCYKTDHAGALVITDPTGAPHRVIVSEGGLVAKHLANGVRELCLYNAGGRCRGKAVVRNGQDGPLWTRSFTYSGGGDLIGVTDTMHGTVRYGYDRAHRLTEEVLPDGSRRPFRFDPAGNLTMQPGLADVQITSGNRLHTANGDQFTYNHRDHISDRHGRSGTTHYDYNALDMLVRCEINGEGWRACYDALGRRISKTWRGETTAYYWDDFRLAAEVRHNGSVRVYVYPNEIALVPFAFVEYVRVEAEPDSGRRYYVFTNQVGVPTRVEDGDGNPCWTARISPYGVVEIDDDSTIEMPLRFPGHYYDPETGLHCNRFRYYSPELGRYLQSDPAGQEGGINVYAYPVNPLVGVDIDGLAGRGGGGGRSTGRNGKSGPAGASARCPVPPRGHPSRKLVDQMIKDGVIVIQPPGDRKVQTAVKADLYRIAATKTGQNTLNTINNNPAGHPVTIRPWDPKEPGNACATDKHHSAPPPHGSGQGTPSTVFYNPNETRPPGSPPDTGLNHELGHAAHNATGTNARDSSPPSPPVVTRSGNLEEHNTTANEDNGYRKERGLPPRTDYRDDLP